MPPSPLAQVVSTAQNYVQAFTQQGSFMKKVVTILAIVFGVVWMYKRIEQARAAERRVRGLRDVNGHQLPANIALNQHQPSPNPASSPASSSSSSSSSSSYDIRNLSPFDRYLSTRGSNIRRQSVCVTLNTSNRALFQQAEAGTVQLKDEAVPILLGLAQNNALYIVCVETDKEKQAALLSCLESLSLFESGLAKHRVLFCSTVKGRSAILRHIEPNLCIDDDKSTLVQLKPFIEQVVHVDANNNASEAGIPSFTSLTQFFRKDSK